MRDPVQLAACQMTPTNGQRTRINTRTIPGRVITSVRWNRYVTYRDHRWPASCAWWWVQLWL
jgi:hypothetical protein